MKTLNILFGAAFAVAATAYMPISAASDNEEMAPGMTSLLQSRLGNMPVEVEKSPAEGVYETKFGTKIAYLTGNGRYLIMGDMIDLQSSVNLTEVARRDIAKDEIGKMNVADMTVFAANKQTKAVLNVFTDTSCGYCQKLHEEVPQLQEAGIEVRYIPFPRGGARGPGYNRLKQVWCAEDRVKGMNIAKEVASGELPAGNCDSGAIVDAGFLLGNKVGVAGTPALFTAEGRKFDGYVPYKQLIPMLLGGS